MGCIAGEDGGGETGREWYEVQTYDVDTNSRKYRGGNSSRVLRVVERAGHGVMVCFEEGADDREDYDGEAGYHDAVCTYG